MRLRYFIYMLLFLVLSCVKEQDIVPEGTVTATIPFTAVVQGSQPTRASITDDFGTGSYIFQEGDKLYISYEEEETVKLYGFLNLISGEGTGNGTFEGTLNCVGGYLPTNNPEVSATLVGSGQDQAEEPATPFFTFSENRIIANYPSEIPYEAGGLAEYVKKYSHFTATNNFDAKSFTLTQQTVFLNFSIENISKRALDGGTEQTTVTVFIKKGESPVRSFTGITLEGDSFIASVHFIGVLDPTDDISSGQVIVQNSTPIICGASFNSDLELQENRYYNVSRSCGGSWDGFTIKATASDTRITFKYANIQYSIDGGISWKAATADNPIPATEDPALSNGEEIWVRGKNTSYANTGGSTPLFTTTNPVNIYGDIMSLMCDENWDFKDAVGNQAFYQAFMGVAVNIPADKNLNLSATTLGTSCYEGMFNGCTNLAKAPVLPATTSVASCYKSMFEGCTNLTAAPDSLTFETVEEYALSRMFFGCTKLETAPALSFMTVNEGGCQEMFSGCTKLTTPPDSLNARSLVKRAYLKMFYNCQKLTTIPNFPNKPGVVYSLGDGTSGKGNEDGICFQMFYNCLGIRSLEGKKLFNSNTPLGKFCFQDMFSTCRNLVKVPNDFLPATELKESCYRGMFQSTAITIAPYLLARTLQTDCYRYMFNSCTSLKFIKCYSSLPGSKTYTDNWVQNAKDESDCEFHYRSSVITGSWPRNDNDKKNFFGVPINWTIVDDDNPNPNP